MAALAPEVVNDIVRNCLSSAMVLLVFAANLKIQAVVMRNQTQAAVIRDEAKLRKKFHCAALGLIIAGFVCILMAVLYVRCWKLLAGYWIPGGITLFAVAGTLIVWCKKLTENNRKKLGQEINIASNVLIGIAVFIIFTFFLFFACSHLCSVLQSLISE